MTWQRRWARTQWRRSRRCWQPARNRGQPRGRQGDGALSRAWHGPGGRSPGPAWERFPGSGVRCRLPLLIDVQLPSSAAVDVHWLQADVLPGAQCLRAGCPGRRNTLRCSALPPLLPWRPWPAAPAAGAVPAAAGGCWAAPVRLPCRAALRVHSPARWAKTCALQCLMHRRCSPLTMWRPRVPAPMVGLPRMWQRACWCPPAPVSGELAGGLLSAPRCMPSVRLQQGRC